MNEPSNLLGAGTAVATRCNYSGPHYLRNLSRGKPEAAVEATEASGLQENTAAA